MSSKTIRSLRLAVVTRGLIFMLLMLSGSSWALAQQGDTIAQPLQPLQPVNELLLDLRVEGQPLGLTILASQRDGQTLVALSELMDGLQFPISVDADQGLAGGWFINEEREFSLDLNAGRVFSNGRSFDTAGSVVASGGDLFVTLDALERWFPLRLRPEIRRLALDVTPLEKIPLQDRLARMNRNPRSAFSIDREPQLPLQPTPYWFLGPHAADLRLNTSTILDDPDSSSTDMTGTYSALVRGDLLWMTSTIAVTGRDDDDITGGRFKLERGSLDAPLALDYVEVGDVDVSNSRGIRVRGGGAREGLNRGLFSDDTVDLRGDIPVDWEVELYRNGVLIDFQVVGNDAQYEFLEVPLEFGENVFEFVFYGPFGEERREQQVFFSGRSSLEFGEISYELAAVQDGRTVFDLSDGGGRGDEGTGRYLADLNVGLFQRMSLGLGADSFEQGGERFEDYRASLTANFATLQTNAGYRWRDQQQDEATALVRARLGESTTTQLRYTEFLEEGLEPEFLPEDLRSWRAEATLTSRLLSVPYALNASHEQRDLSSGSSASLGTTLRVFDRDRFSTSLNYFRDEDETAADRFNEDVRGAFSYSTQLRPWSFRAGADYSFSPNTELNSVFGSADLRIDRRMSMNFDVDHTATSDFTNYRIGFNWQLDQLVISPQVIYDSNDRWVGLLSISTSLNTAPGRLTPEFSSFSHTGFGAVKSRAFVDNNGDGIWNSGDEPLPGARVEALQSWRGAPTGADGNAYLTRLGPYRRTDIALDPTSIEDVELTPSTEGVSVEPRPASWSVVDFPLVRAMELEGHVYFTPAPGAEPLPQSRAPVELLNVDGEVVSRQRAAFDGFYLFSSVLPGTYQVRLGESLAGNVSRAPGSVEVTSAGGVIRDLDFVLEPWRGQSIQDRALPVPADQAEEPRPGFAPTETTSFAPIAPVVAPEPEPVVTEEPLEELPEVTAQPEPANAAPAPAGNWYVQLGAFGEISNAESLWQTLLNQGALSEGLEPVYESSGALTRLLVGPGRTEASARSLCNRWQADGRGCLLKQR